MDDGSGSRWWTKLRQILGGRSDSAIEEAIHEAEDEGELETQEAAMLLNVLALEDTQAREIMVPRIRVVFGEFDQSLEEISKLIIDSGHSRIPIYREDKDDIVGIVHAKDVLRAFMESSENSDLKNILRPPHFFPENMDVKNLLLDFQTRKVHLGIAQDEYGGTSGIVTLEDILEEIVGEIEDEYDPPRPASIQQLRDGQLLVSGLAPLDSLNEILSPPLHSDQVETVGGFVSEIAGRVPRRHESFMVRNHTIIVKDADAKHVRWVIIKPSGHDRGQD